MAKIKVDGKYYEEGQQPDFGSIQNVGVRGSQRDYQGLIADKDKLPKYDDLATGSSATLIDPTGTESTIVAKYDAQLKQWLNLKGGVVA